VVTPVRPAPTIKPGMMIGEKYRIERELGRGGFGVVVRAIHLALDRRVAIKVLLEDEGATEAEWAEDAARFRREAKATAALRSQHVVRVLDVDVLDSGHPYIVMEFLQGKTLHEVVYSSDPLPIEDAVDYTIQILAALADAHAAGIVHRDLKPANVVLSTGVGGAPLVKVLDFGVSKMVAASSHRLTRTGAVVGTVAYMAPEQMVDAKRVDGRADLWSAGLVLYEALSRSHPFGAAARGVDVVTSIVNDPIIPLRDVRPDVPAALEEVVTRLLEKSADRRFSTAIEVADALAPFAPLRSRPVLEEIRRAGPPSGAAASMVAAVDVPAPTSGVTVRTKRRKRSAARRVLWTLVGVVFLLGVALAVVSRWRPRILRALVSGTLVIPARATAPSAASADPPASAAASSTPVLAEDAAAPSSSPTSSGTAAPRASSRAPLPSKTRRP